MLNEKFVFLYTIISSLIALWIFLYGYIPLTAPPIDPATIRDLPTEIDNFSIKPEEMYSPHIKKLVLIVIDSLKMDFLIDKSKDDLPYTTKLIDSEEACLIPYKLPPPSIAMQKLQSLTTGTSSSFMETILTFSNAKLKTDNIFRQAKEKNLNISIHGADVWTQLFPDYFMRNKTVSTLKIFDYIEVDVNVTKTLLSEMRKNDWDWLILHYLGLKHLGFTHYSNSKAIVPKLQELDNVIKFAHKKLIAEKVDYMLLVVGDTGIGKLNDPTEYFSNPATLAPYIVIGKPCSSSRPSGTMSEFDMTPTLSVLTGLPIPASSYGSINPALLTNFTNEEQLYASHYNAKRLINIMSQVHVKYNKHPAYLLFKDAVTEHGKYLRDSNSSNNCTLLTKISLMYNEVTKCIFEKLNIALNTSDVAIQYMAFILLFEAMVILVNRPDKDITNMTLNVTVILATNLLIVVWVLATGICRRGTSFVYMTETKGMIIATVILIMICNSYILSMQRSFITSLIMAIITVSTKSKELIETISSKVDPSKPAGDRGVNSLFVILVWGTVFHALSLMELSYIKCEKWLWFFLWASICFWIIYNRMQKFCRDPIVVRSESVATVEHDYGGEISVVISILIMHRAILAYTMVEHWLAHSDNKICASLCLFFGLVLLAFTCSIYYEPYPSKLDKWITYTQLGVISCSIYMCNVARENVLFFYYPKSSSGSVEMLFFWFSWIFILGYGLGIATIRTCYKGVSSMKQLLAAGIACWAFFAAMLTRSHKVMLIPIQMLYSQAMGDIFKKHNQSFILSHVWLGHLFFYYQGYTYSLDSVDRAAGLLVSNNVCFLMFGVLLVMNTFSAPILSYLTCIFGILNNNLEKSTSDGILITNETFGCCRLLLMSVYTLGMLVHRHNEWLWSILSPKLLYEVVHTFLLFTIMLAMQGVAFMHDHAPYLALESS